MTKQPDPTEFSVNERENEYSVLLTVTGTITERIKANSLEEAREKANEIADKMECNSGFAPELDEVDEVGFEVRKLRPLFRILRDGQKMQVSYLEAGDAPREPDERGF